MVFKKWFGAMALALLMPTTALAANWQWVASDDCVGYFFDTQTVKYGRDAEGKIDKNIIRFQIKEAFTEKYTSQEAKSTNNPRWLGVSFATENIVYDKQSKVMKFITPAYYDAKGDILNVYYNAAYDLTTTEDNFAGEIAYAAERYCGQHDESVIRNTPEK